MNTQLLSPSDPLWSDVLDRIGYDVYHLPHYLSLEANRTHSIAQGCLISQGAKAFFIPYLVRRCADVSSRFSAIENVFEVVSPYGYPGILLSEAGHNSTFVNAAMNRLIALLMDKGVCSAFFRLHPILNADLVDIFPTGLLKVEGETVSVDLQLSQAEIWHDTRAEHRNKINRLKRAGMLAHMLPYEEFIDQFIEIYYETMARVGADCAYYFDHLYFTNLSKLAEKIHFCAVESESQIACAGLFFECNGIVQYHLGGTRSAFLKQGPSKLMFDYVRTWAKARGNKIFHLGGGVGVCQDSLYRFKAGFSKKRQMFATLRIVVDREKYAQLTYLQAQALNTDPACLFKSTFFPAYRASALS